MDCFKVSKRSWHWKIYNFFNYKVPRNFCDYFWEIALPIIGTGFIVNFIINLFVDFYLHLSVFIFVLAIMGLCHAAISLKRKVFDKNNPKENKDGFFKTKFKSFKGKYCPGIEIVD
ncbi:MAG: hypothetical protein WC055_00715 [Melioribacteraceae bacterium]